MHKTDADGATVTNEFTDGVPAVTEATVVGSKWLNTVQRELIAVVEAGGVTPDDAEDGQVLEALNVLYGRLEEPNAWGKPQTFFGDGDDPAVAGESSTDSDSSGVKGVGTGAGVGGRFTSVTGYAASAISSAHIGAYCLGPDGGLLAKGTAGAGVSASSDGGGPAIHTSRPADRGHINLQPTAGDPSSPIDGDIWYNSTSHTLKVRVNGVTRTVTVT